MASDPDASAVARLSERSDDDLLAIVGLLDEATGADTNAILRVLDPDLARSFEEEGLVPPFTIDLNRVRENGRARVEAYMAARREHLRNLICPIAKSSDADRDLLVTLAPAVLADAVAQSGGKPSAALLAMAAYVLTRKVDALCSDWDPPSGPTAVVSA